MSKLDDLINELCPDGVEYRELQDVLNIRNGSDYKSFGEGDYPVYGSGGIMTYVDRFAYDKPSVLIPRKGSIDKLYYVDEPFWNVDTVFYTEINEEKVLPRYVYHYLLNEHLEKLNTAGGVPSLTQKVLNRVKIPVPPLEVQREIVRVLDSFTLLTAELTAELTARNKQYDYYRIELLSDDEGIEYKLDDICQIVDCPHTSPKWKNEGIPVIRNFNLINGRIDTRNLSYVDKEEYESRIKRIKPQENDILFSREAPIGNVGIVPANFTCCQGQRVVLLRPYEDIVIPKYLLYSLQGGMVRKQIETAEKTGSTVSNFNIGDLRKLKISIPDFERQKYVIDILDKFSILSSDIKEGLPAEIEGRRKQYEYYRDKLLSFEEIGA